MRAVSLTTSANSNLQNKINISLVFHLIREHGPVYRAQIAEQLHLSAPAVSRAVGNLLEAGYILEAKKTRTKAGNVVAPVVVNSELGYVIGIDLMKEVVRMSVSNFTCQIVAQHDSFKMSQTADLESRLISEIRHITGSAPTDSELKAICVGIPAMVNPSGSATNAILYDNLRGRNLKTVLEQEFDVPVFVENVANLSALAESAYGAGKNAKTFVCVTVGNGIGAAVIVDGNLYRGAHGYTGEIGFHLTAVDDVVSESSQKGPLEQMASVQSLRERAIMAIEEGCGSSLTRMARDNVADVTPAMVCHAALEGDEICTRVVRDAANRLAVAITDVVLVLDPERVILTGEICHLPGVEELFVEPIRCVVSRSVPFEAPEIELSDLNENAVVIGALHLAVESLLVGAYPYRLQS